MGKFLQRLFACAVFLLPSCFQAQSTFGYPCVVNEDCDGAQLCIAGVCESAFGVAESTGGTTGDATGDSMGEGTSASDDSSSDSTGEPSDDDASDTDTGGETMETMVRLVHAAPDLGPVDVYVAGDSVPLVGGLDYAEASDRLTVDAGDYTFEFRAAGAEAVEPALFVSEVVTVAEGAPSSIIAAGLTVGVAADELRLITVQEDWGTSLADRARVRVIHAGSDAPSLTVAGLEGPDFIVDRFGGSDPDGVPIPTAGGDRIELLDSDGLRTAFTAPPLTEGDEVLLVATGLFGSLAREEDGFALIAVGDQGALGRIRQDPQVFTVHGARDAAVLENCTGTGGSAVAANLSYGEVQNAFVSPGEYNFEVHNYPSGCTGALNPGGTASGPLEAGERYMLLLTGEVTPVDMEPGIQVAPFQERFTLDGQGVAQVRFIHGASFTQIYVGAVTEGEIKEADILTAPIAWRSESQEQTLPEGSYVLGAADAGIPFAPPLSPLVTFDAGVPAGARLWGVVTGDPSIDDGDDQFLQVMIVNTAEPGWSIALIDVN